MSKIIIEIEDGVSERHALLLVADVIKMGRISNFGTEYAHLVTYGKEDGSSIVVSSHLNKRSDRFRVWQHKN